MDTVRLPNGPDESLQQAVRFLSSWIAPPDYRLGGGTALAALWSHRHSTDIDLAANADVFEDRVGSHFEAIHQALQAERARGTIKRLRVTRNMLAWTLPSGPVALLRSRLSLEEFSPMTHKEENTDVPLAPVSAILYGKIHGRILSTGRLVQRDAYDLAVACLVDKGAVEETLALIPAEDKESILTRIRDARQDRAADDRTLLAPKYAELAKNPWDALVVVLRDTFGCE